MTNEAVAEKETLCVWFAGVLAWKQSLGKMHLRMHLTRVETTKWGEKGGG